MLKEVIIVNSCISLCLLIFFSKKKEYQKMFFSSINLLMPLGGLMIILGYQFILHCVKDDSAYEMRYEEEQDSNHSMDESSKANAIVPVTDALLLNNTKVKKQVLITILRDDKTRSIEVLQEALASEDYEASHYAAIALMELKDSFNIALSESMKLLEENPKDGSYLMQYANVLGKFIKSKLSDKIREEHLKQQYVKVLAQLIDSKWKTSFYYEEKIKYELELNHLEIAYEYAIRFKEEYSGIEEAYFYLMNYYYKMYDYSNIQLVIEELKNSKVKLSREGIKRLRFWSGGY